MANEYHIKQFQPIEPHWPKGGWSVYNITAEEIIARKNGDSWCGFVGCFETLEDVVTAIGNEASKG